MSAHRPSLRDRVLPDGKSPLALGLVLIGVLAAYNNLATLLSQDLHNRLYVPINLTATGILLLAAWRAGLTWRELGFRPASPMRAARWGTALGAVLGAPVLLATVVPETLQKESEFLAEGSRAAGNLAFVILIRIPLGTALWEEVAFRGALYGAWLRIAGLRVAVLVSSLIFGLWHIGPTYRTLSGGEVFANPWLLGLGVAGGVIVTAVGGLFFAWLRRKSESIYAPILTHWLINAFGAAAAFSVG